MPEQRASGHGFPPVRKEGRCVPYGPELGTGYCLTGCSVLELIGSNVAVLYRVRLQPSSAEQAP